MLPGMDGFAACRCASRREVWTPVLMLTARDAVEDRIQGLDTGADDYLFEAVLPSPSSLRAFARSYVAGPASGRRSSRSATSASIPQHARAWRGETELELSAKEFSLLEVFMRRAGETLSRVQLLDGAWDMAFESRSNVIDVYVRYLREKIDRPFGRSALETVRGVGYRLREDGG